MNSRVVQLALKQQQLQLRCATQRLQLQQQIRPILPLFVLGDRLRAGMDFIRQRPYFFAATAVLLLAIRPRKTLRWLRRGLFAWQFFSRLRNPLGGLSAKP